MWRDFKFDLYTHNERPPLPLPARGSRARTSSNVAPPHKPPGFEDIPRYGRYAARYRAYRPAYPDAIFDRLVAAIGPRRRHAVDLGAGTGQATNALLSRFERVTAIEPDADMAALVAQNERLTLQVATAEAALLADGEVDAVLAATAFHWMDAHRVCPRIARWLRPGGAFMAVAFARAQPQSGAVGEVLARYNALWRSRMHDRLSDWRAYGDLITDTQTFATVETFELYADFVWTPDQTAGFLLSTSFGAAYALSTGDEAGHHREFAQALADAAPEGVIHVRLPLEGALARL